LRGANEVSDEAIT